MQFAHGLEQTVGGRALLLFDAPLDNLECDRVLDNLVEGGREEETSVIRGNEYCNGET